MNLFFTVMGIFFCILIITIVGSLIVSWVCNFYNKISDYRRYKALSEGQAEDIIRLKNEIFKLKNSTKKES